MDWGLLTPEDIARQNESLEKIRERARRRLDRDRDDLPKLSKRQAAIVVEMMVDAYRAGVQDEADQWGFSETVRAQDQWEKARDLSRKGVQARRRNSKRRAIIEAFEAAGKARRDVSVEQLAKDHGVSRATAYRALKMKSAKRR